MFGFLFADERGEVVGEHTHAHFAPGSEVVDEVLRKRPMGGEAAGDQGDDDKTDQYQGDEYALEFFAQGQDDGHHKEHGDQGDRRGVALFVRQKQRNAARCASPRRAVMNTPRKNV